MSVIRVNKTNDYTVMSNSHFREYKMSLKAKGLLSEMLSLPNDWDYTIAGLVKINKDNETSVKSALEELKDFGYLIVTKKMPNETESGRIEYIYDIYEKPKQEGEKQDLENLGVEIQHLENHRQLNTNNKLLNNKLLNNNNIGIPFIDVINYLNEKAHTNYKYTTDKTKRLINARMMEGFTFEDFKKVIDNKCGEWLGTDMEKYLRPETLFGTKFEGYLNQTLKGKEQKPSWFNQEIPKDNTTDKDRQEFNRMLASFK